MNAVTGDAGNPADLASALDGCTAVVSAISGFGPQSGSTPSAVDRDGNINLMKAAEAAGVRQFVHFSMQRSWVNRCGGVAFGVPFTPVREALAGPDRSG